MKIYIAGAITDNPGAFLQFKAAEYRLAEQGNAVLNPMKNLGFEYKDYIDMGLAELSKCDAIYMLEGWENSTGAILERMYAETVGIEVMCQWADKESEAE